jgi:hypothetical protein
VAGQSPDQLAALAGGFPPGKGCAAKDRISLWLWLGGVMINLKKKEYTFSQKTLFCFEMGEGKKSL